jgi:2-phosphosulfolactate phosphatase
MNQADYDLRFEWGPVGAAVVAPGAAVVVVVDVLSFTTTLSMAVERGIAVMPFPWRDAEAVAEEHDAVLAVGRSRGGPGRISLSPQTLLDPPAGVRRLVLPSPNGSAIASSLARSGATVVGASLRNARAVAVWVGCEAAGRAVAVVAAGERWPDGSLRPAVEDLWGAGAVIEALAGGRSVSPEASGARTAYASVAGSVSDSLALTGSGCELAGIGFAGDVAIAAEESVSDAVPVLRDGWFVDGGSGQSEDPG